jgi:uncharacterized lipoprotein YmbA
MAARSLFWVSVLALAACSSPVPEVRHYALTVQPARAPAAPAKGDAPYALTAVVLPEALNRPEIVLRADQTGVIAVARNGLEGPLRDVVKNALNVVAVPSPVDSSLIELRTEPNGIVALPRDRWATPLPDMLKRTLTAELSARVAKGFLTGPLPAPEQQPVRRITVTINEFAAGTHGQVTLDASWSITAPGGAASDDGPFAHRVTHFAAANLIDMTQTVAALSLVVGMLADDIAATVTVPPAPRKK